MEYVWVLPIVLGPWSNRDAMTNAAILGHQLTAFWRHLCVDAFRHQSTAPSERQLAEEMQQRCSRRSTGAVAHASLCFSSIAIATYTALSPSVNNAVRVPCSWASCRGCGDSPTPAARILMQLQRPVAYAELKVTCSTVLRNPAIVVPWKCSLPVEPAKGGSCTPVRIRRHSEASDSLRQNPRLYFGYWSAIILVVNVGATILVALVWWSVTWHWWR